MEFDALSRRKSRPSRCSLAVAGCRGIPPQQSECILLRLSIWTGQYRRKRETGRSASAIHIRLQLQRLHGTAAGLRPGRRFYRVALPERIKINGENMFNFNDSRYTHMPFAAVRPDGQPEEFCCIQVSELGNCITFRGKNGSASRRGFPPMRRSAVRLPNLRTASGKFPSLPEAGKATADSGFTGCTALTGNG